jgi:UDP-glucose 4-epimerase
VYGVPRAVPIVEQRPLAPVSPYGASKMICERMLQDCAAASPLTYMALRYFNAAGADPAGDIGECHVPETHAIPLLLDAAAGDAAAFTVFGDDYPTPDGTCIRDYVHVDDLAEAHLLALAGATAGEHRIYNLGSGAGFSVLEVVEAVRRVTGHPMPTEVGPRRPGDPAVLVASSARIRDQLGWVTRKPTVDEMVADAWAFERSRAAVR